MHHLIHHTNAVTNHTIVYATTTNWTFSKDSMSSHGEFDLTPNTFAFPYEDDRFQEVSENPYIHVSVWMREGEHVDELVGEKVCEGV